jgi:hypothetical protein
MISYSKTIRAAAMLCTILTVGLAVGQDGVVRMSDRSGKAAPPDGVVRMRPQQQRPQVKPASHSQDVSEPVPDMSFSYSGDGAGCGLTPSCSVPTCAVPTCAAPICEAEPDCAVPVCTDPQPTCGYCPQVDACVGDSCCDVSEPECCPSCDTGCECGWDTGCECECGSCYSAMDCNQVFSSGRRSGKRACRQGRNRRHWQGSNTTLFARCVDSGTGYGCRDFYHGQAMSYHNKNARLADKLFGWMIPSGCGGQGCPPIGKYHMTYADQPDYINPNDTQIYAAQGYGMPITVPLAPNVNHAYNYSAGIPASRITTIGTYNPQTSPQRLPHQTW